MFRRYRPQHARGRRRTTAAALVLSALAAGPIALVTVHSGDTLSGIAARHCGSAGDWTGIWQANRSIVSNPDLIYPGQRLTIRCRQVPVYVHQPASQLAVTRPGRPAPVSVFSGADPSGHLSRAQVGQLWLDAGGPAWAEWSAEEVAWCESGWNTGAWNPSGASGLWQILGYVVAGNLFDARVNAANAVAKFRASGDSWAQWVCRP